MSAEAILIWRVDPYTMGATLGSDVIQGDAEFSRIGEPCGFVQQFIAGLEAAEKLKTRLGMVGHYSIIWSRDTNENLPALGYCEGAEPEAEDVDPADWWKSC